jgi:hypothetical protein
MTFEYKLPRDIHTWCQESDYDPHLQKILRENSDLIDVHERKKLFIGVEHLYCYRLSDRGYTLLSLGHSNMIQTLKLYTQLTEWPTRK